MPGTCKEFYRCITFDPRDKTRCQENSRAGGSRKGCGIRQPECQLCVCPHYTRDYTQVIKQLQSWFYFSGREWMTHLESSYEKIEINSLSRESTLLFFNKWEKPWFREFM